MNKEEINNLLKNCEEAVLKQFEKIDKIKEYNQEKVLNAFKNNKLALRHFSGTTGYGYGDEGREALNKVFADVFKAESAICTPNIQRSYKRQAHYMGNAMLLCYLHALCLAWRTWQWNVGTMDYTINCFNSI